jgi:ABC-type nitrate/sulfonate/bicarbonate transport system substrate-binding protein
MISGLPIAGEAEGPTAMGSNLEGIFGGQDDTDDGRRAQARDFVGRYEQGEPWADFSGQEAAERYGRVVGRVSREQLRSAAEAAYGRMPRGQRAELGRLLGLRMGFLGTNQIDDPRELAGMTSRFQEQDAGGLAGIFVGGDGPGALADSPLAKAALGGIAAVAVERMMDVR